MGGKGRAADEVIAVLLVMVGANDSNNGGISLKCEFSESSSSLRKSPLIEKNESIRSSGLADQASDCVERKKKNYICTFTSKQINLYSKDVYVWNF